MPDPKLPLSEVVAEEARQALSKKYERMRESVMRREEREERVEQMLARSSLDEIKKDAVRMNLQTFEGYAVTQDLIGHQIGDFQMLKIIGKGSFGEVSLVKHTSTRKLYALKIMSKGRMLKKNQLRHIKAEKTLIDVIEMQQSIEKERGEAKHLSSKDLLAKFHFTFQDQDHLYLVMEYLSGGDLMGLLIKLRTFTEKMTIFYMAEAATALACLHDHGFVHRDVKPDNFLFDWRGHLKLSDFGLCKQLSSKSLYESHCQKAFSTVGTPDYIAPEILHRTGYNFSCDFWSLGVVAFECVIGFPPFASSNPQSTCKKVASWKTSLEYPPDTEKKLTHNCLSFLRRLLTSPALRLGSLKGLDDFKNHSWLKNINFSTLHEAKAPFQPHVGLDVMKLVKGIENDSINPRERTNVISALTKHFDEFDAEKSELRKVQGQHRRDLPKLQDLSDYHFIGYETGEGENIVDHYVSRVEKICERAN